MEKINDDELYSIARSREKECAIDSLFFKERLDLLGYTNWGTAVLPAMLSAFAGASIFSHASIASDWITLTGGAALLSALLVAIHKGLNCDAYQAECRRLIQAYGGLAKEYRTLHELKPPNAQEKLIEYDAILAEIKKTATADVPEKFRKKERENWDKNLES